MSTKGEEEAARVRQRASERASGGPDWCDARSESEFVGGEDTLSVSVSYSDQLPIDGVAAKANAC